MTVNPNWRVKGEAKRQAILKAIPEKWRLATPPPPATEIRDVTGSYIQQYLNEREIEITESDAVDIAKQTTSGGWSAVEVTEAFCHRAALAHQLVNCLHEVFFEAAIEDARKLDKYFAEHEGPTGPLHGLPVSLKDQFHIKSVETTMGYIGWIGTFEGQRDDPRYKSEESELTRELRSLGAVLYCKTSVPATLMAGETVNNIIGYTWNPKNRLLSSGGSSGGEGALIALRGSPVGIGTDIGGSVRAPAGFNFLYGLRPSSGRMPYQGAANSMDGQSSILSVIGPLAQTARSLSFIFKSILVAQPWYHDPLVLELPWRESITKETRSLIDQAKTGKSTLAFGLMPHDGMNRVHPPVARAMRLVEQTLKRLGHTVISWSPPSHSRGNKIAGEIFGMDGGKNLQHHLGLSGEPQAPQVIVKQGGNELSASKIAALNVSKRDYQKEYMDYWNSTARLTGTGRPIDGVLLPVAPHAAAIPNHYKVVNYTAFVNVLDYTSVVIPVTFADKMVDVKSDDRTSKSDDYIDWSYDADTYDGAPVGVQLLGRRLQEEKMLTLAEYIGEEIALDA
ncbi:hypothetical protein N7478_004210 [Penicillium angulare]|uniref:uncharacterized protein n=1 Tax=Penicillium angulare TaxID=116970 RepID=UPI0025402143|nr:uncharacterized protein N7478_004210 [Penicillium angulare]KAJ5278838.1 hypothetical protein N7478_004210 [Penicillium angulare]